MRVRDVAGVVILGLGLFALIQAVSFISATALFFGGTGSSWNVRIGLLLAYLVPMVLLLLLADHLIRRHRAIARGFYPEDETREGSLSAEDLRSILLRVLGVYFVISALPGVLGFASGLAFFCKTGGDGQSLLDDSRLWDHFAQYVGVLLQAAIGIFLYRRGHLPSRKPKAAPKNEADGNCPECGRGYRLANYRDDAAERSCSFCGALLPGEEIDKRDDPAPCP